MKKVIIGAIKVYQKTLSPDHGWFSGKGIRVCRYEPSCSQYAIDAIQKYGVIKGITMGSWRVLRCNPFSKGGHDPVK